MPEIEISVQRSPGAAHARPRFETHRVALGEKASILDALFTLQRGPCPDLAFRFSCRVGMCGSCAMVVNGREQLTCSTLVKTVGSQLRIEPLRNLPVVRDVAVDLKPFFHGLSPRAAAFHSARRSCMQMTFTDCPTIVPNGRRWTINPSALTAVPASRPVPLVTLNPRYLGPMALHRALNLVVDPRDKARAERLNLVAGETGAFRCHTLGNCRDSCPRGISPTHSMSV